MASTRTTTQPSPVWAGAWRPRMITRLVTVAGEPHQLAVRPRPTSPAEWEWPCRKAVASITTTLLPVRALCNTRTEFDRTRERLLNQLACWVLSLWRPTTAMGTSTGGPRMLLRPTLLLIDQRRPRRATCLLHTRLVVTMAITLTTAR